MASGLLTPLRTVALITDEALCLFSTGAKGVRLVETVPWDAENFERNVATIISKDCGGRPVLILNDMVEISFRKERIPKVSPIDKAGVIQRKLNLAFPNYPVKAALPLKEKISKTDKAIAASVYIFAAVPASPAFSKTISAVSRSLAPIAGFGLLPTESSDMVKALTQKQKLKAKTAWTIFIGQHQNGGLRQIVTKNGELALTRMTPVADMNNDPKGWLRDVSQEFKATMSYLARFGYAQEDGLSVFVIANKNAAAELEEAISVPCNYSPLTVSEAAKALGLSVGRAAEQNYADILHVAWAGRKSKLVLPMRANAVDAVSKPRQTALAAMLLLFMSASFLAYQALDQVQGLSTINSDFEDAQNRKQQVDVEYQKEVQRKEALGFDVKLVQSSLKVLEQQESRNIRILKMFAGIGEAMGKDLKIDTVNVTRIEKIVDPLAPPPEPQYDPVTGAEIKPKEPLYESMLQMTFPSTTDVLKGNQEVKDFRDRIQALLPDTEVSVTKFLKDYEYTNQIVVETGDLQREDLTQDFVAQITLKGIAP